MSIDEIFKSGNNLNISSIKYSEKSGLDIVNEINQEILEKLEYTNKKKLYFLNDIDNSIVVLIFKYSDDLTNGESLKNGWTAFTFIFSDEFTNMKVDDKLLGRRLILSGKKSIYDVLDMFGDSDIKDGKLFLEIDDDLPLKFKTNLFSGSYIIEAKNKDEEKPEQVWLTRK